jgi:hypothetical protein
MTERTAKVIATAILVLAGLAFVAYQIFLFILGRVPI